MADPQKPAGSSADADAFFISAEGAGSARKPKEEATPAQVMPATAEPQRDASLQNIHLGSRDTSDVYGVSDDLLSVPTSAADSLLITQDNQHTETDLTKPGLALDQAAVRTALIDEDAAPSAQIANVDMALTPLVVTPAAEIIGSVGLLPQGQDAGDTKSGLAGVASPDAALIAGALTPLPAAGNPGPPMPILEAEAPAPVDPQPTPIEPQPVDPTPPVDVQPETPAVPEPVDTNPPIDVQPETPAGPEPVPVDPAPPVDAQPDSPTDPVDEPPAPDVPPVENHAPTATVIADQAATEDAAFSFNAGAHFSDVDAGDHLTFSVSGPSWLSIDAATGQLSGTAENGDVGAHNITVTATDSSGASVQRSFDISVANTNDGPTVLTATTLAISEFNDDNDDWVGRVQGFDPDAGDALRYELIDDGGGRFQIDAQTGDIYTVHGGFDHEAEPFVSITVRAVDESGAAITRDFTVAVTNENEAPVLANPSATIAENSAAGTVVAVLDAVDPEGDPVSYRLLDPNNTTFEIVGNELRVKAGAELDYETLKQANPQAAVSVIVVSSDGHGGEIGQHFVVHVTDANEAPTITAIQPQAAIEDAAFSFNAGAHFSDVDAGDHLTFSVSGPSWLSIDAATGQLAGTAANGDVGAHSITVTATDSSGAAVSQTFEVMVANSNDAPNQLEISNASVRENLAGGIIGLLTVSDVDVGDTHSFAVDDARFEVVAGQLKLKSGISLDHEAASSLTINVTATDTAGASITKAVQISVENQNEAPTGLGLSNKSVAENAAGAVIGTVSASDPEGDAIAFGVNDSRFEVINGQLKLKDGVSLNYEAEPVVSLTITATDSNNLSTSSTMTINVTNLAEGPTALTVAATTPHNFVSNGSFELQQTGGTDYGSWYTVDTLPGWTREAGPTYEVLRGSGWGTTDGTNSLDMDATPGNLTISQTVAGLAAGQNYTLSFSAANRSTSAASGVLEVYWGGALVSTVTPEASSQNAPPSYSFTVVAGAGDGTNKLTFKEVGTVDNIGVTLDNVRLVNATPVLSVTENAANGVVVGSIGTLDPDTGDSFQYSLVDNAGGRFAINNATGVITVANSSALDFETNSSHTIRVRSIDSTGLSIEQTMTIQVANVTGQYSGTGGSETLTGSSEDDNMLGFAGNDTIYGAAGSDWIEGNAGNDALYGGLGDDRFIVRGASDGFDLVDGGTGTDQIVAMADNTVIGLSSLTAVEQINANGFSGITISLTNYANMSFANTTLTGIVRIDGSANSDTITGSAGDDVIRGGGSGDTLNGGNGNDIFEVMGISDGLDAYNGGAGTDTIRAMANNAIIGISTMSNMEAITSNGFSGVTVKVADYANIDFTNVTLTGIDRIEGSNSSETITGSAGDDVIRGGGSGDTLNGGNGNDIFEVMGISDGLDAYNGGAGTDTIRAMANNAIIGISSMSNIEAITSNGFSGVTIKVADYANVDFTNVTLTGIVRIDGSNSSETITGSGGDDVIRGGESGDTLNGGNGNDIFEVMGSSDGLDVYNGGAGTDTIRAMANNATVGISTMTNIEAITANGFSGVTVKLADYANVDFTNVTLTGIDRIEGSNSSETITGSAGDDVISGGGSGDTLNGGNGNDVFLVGGTATILSGSTNLVTDGQFLQGAASGSFTTYTAGQSFGGWAVTSGSVDLIGNYWAGPSGSSSIDLDGIQPGAIRQTLATVSGQTYTVTFQMAVNSDAPSGATRTVRVSAGDSTTDLSIIKSANASNTAMGWSQQSFTFTATNSTTTLDFQSLSQSGGFGATIGDIKVQASSTSFDGFDVYNGGSGNDIIQASGSNTVIGISSMSNIEAITSNGFGGVTVKIADYANIDFTNVTLTGIARVDGSNSSETITGSAGDDVIRGGASGDALYGGNGSDIFEVMGTGDGFDVYNGGAGTDTIRAMANGAVIGISSMAGIEAITSDGFTGVTVKIADYANIDFTNVTLTGIDRIEGANSSETITGSAGDDVIRGGASGDTLNGGNGNDIFEVMGTTDGLDVYNGGAGTDTIRAMANNATIGISTISNVETITSNGFSGVTIKVADYANIDFTNVTLTGITRIDGSASSETIRGSAGADYIAGGASGDALYGGLGADTLYGGDGNDSLYGGVGSDALYGEAGSDLFIWATGDGSDQIFGGAGGGWIDSLSIGGQGAPSTAGNWIIQLTDGTQLDGAGASGTINLGTDASGSIIFDDGVTLAFQHLERVQWS